MADYGLKGSKAGFDAKTATDDQLAFSSKFNLFKAATVGTTTVSVPANSQTTALISHGESYRPGFNFFYQIDASGNNYSANDNATIFPANAVISTKLFDALAYVDSTDLVIKIGNNDLVNAHNVFVKYYLYKDEVE